VRKDLANLPRRFRQYPHETNSSNSLGCGYRKSGGIIFTDVVVDIVDHICANEELFQSSERLSTVSRSATMMHATKVRVLAMPVIITIIHGTPDWPAFQTKDPWLLTNSEVLKLQQPLYEGNTELH
jgi:hypothetical protein